jgi:hypothetical protein
LLIPGRRLPLSRLLVFFVIGIGIYLAELAKPLAQSLSAVLTAFQVVLTVLGVGLAILQVWPPKLVRAQREPIEGQFYECRSIPIIALIVIGVIAVIFYGVARFVQDSSITDEAKGGIVLFSSVLVFPLVAVAGLLTNRIIFTPTSVCFWGRLFSEEILMCLPPEKVGPWAAVGPIAFPVKARYVPFMWHLVFDPHSLVAASMRILPGASS